ncbi:glutamate racemase [Motiliproteus sp. MSK22-1]|uniref:glutamate racemase n=1 Tax=Motiliproteus sp. MSK22-1 TaxID=1897630 RepID=UPI0009780C13|nr:glutamate racemase [Motiliproteus sp. MSK22-1]OMH38906.1 glutamate racemase [Motiliproteus sp. MSK22-1]
MNRPVGIFDSGVGGISIALGVRKILPSEDLLYVADQEFSPYGSKSNTIVEARAEIITTFLSQQGCKAIVVACNTATVNSINRLRTMCSIPIVGVEPGIKPAALQSNTGIIGVLATEKTLSSESFQALRSQFSAAVNIEIQACPRFVELVEKNNLNSVETLKIAEDYVLPLIAKGADHIVLGCTHYSFLTPVIEQIVGDKATIIDTAIPVSLELKRQLSRRDLLNPQDRQGLTKFWSSKASEQASEKISQLWGNKVVVADLNLHKDKTVSKSNHISLKQRDC